MARRATSNVRKNLHPALLVTDTVAGGQGRLSSTGALAVNTGKFSGRAPNDKYMVRDSITDETVDWGGVNFPIDAVAYQSLYQRITDFAGQLDHYYVRDAYACSDPKYRLGVRIHTEFAWQSLFAYNMLLRPTADEHANFVADWEVFAFPSFEADPTVDGTRQPNFAIINFTERRVIIGGTGYTGEIKKGIFSVLNFLLPTEHNVLPMHCSANVGAGQDTSLFFGLSGTGKTTLSNDPDRRLIGDDEHGWSDSGVFNFEGGCYAKTIDLSSDKEPLIYNAIKFGALLENVGFEADGCTPNYEDASITQNTRVSYPIHHIDNIVGNSRGGLPRNIFFLTCDAFGVLPPISRLTDEQAMYHFISGYTAKIAGTEEGINEPQAAFSACFGAPFLPLKPTVYANMLGKRLRLGHDSQGERINVWLINTGWTGGGYGVGSRLSLKFTRAMIKAALDGKLNECDYVEEEVFGLWVPTTCPGVPSNILKPRETWPTPAKYDQAITKLAKLFIANFKKYSSTASAEVIAAGPKVEVLSGA